MTNVIDSPTNRNWQLRDTLFLVLLFLLAFGAAAWNLAQAPDLFIDEILYTRVGTRLAAEGALVWDSGRPLVVHPPLFFLVEAAYLQLTGDPAAQLYAVGDIFAAVAHTRYLNAIFAGLTASILYWLGQRLHSRKLGLLLAVVFLLDPFSVRTNRRAMLETLAGLLSLSGLGVLLTALPRPVDRSTLLPGRVFSVAEGPNLRRAVVAGILLGAALLTKELAFTAPLTVGLFGLWQWQRRRQTADAVQVALPYFLVVVISALAALLVPLWAILAGHWERYVDVKLLSLQRLLGLVHLSGWNRSGISLTDMILQRFLDYGSSYLLLGLGGLALLFLLLVARHDSRARLLATWGLVQYPFYGFVALFGSGNVQFFYFLVLPAIVLLGYALATLPQTARQTQLARRLPLGVRNRLFALAALALLLMLLPYNASHWVLSYHLGRDDGYRQLSRYVEKNVPADAPINASGDASKFEYFLPDRAIAEAATPQEAQSQEVHYFVLAPKDIQFRYGRVTPQLAAWITANGQRLFAFTGDSFGLITLYYVPYTPPAGAQAPIATQQVFPAEGARIDIFLWLLAGWVTLLTLLLLLLPQPQTVFTYRSMETTRRNA